MHNTSAALGSRCSASLLGIAEGDGFTDAISGFCLSGPWEGQRMIGEEPGRTGVELQDAYVGASGERLAKRWGAWFPSNDG